jgi:hypothetical protein
MIMTILTLLMDITAKDVISTVALVIMIPIKMILIVTIISIMM